MNRPTPTRWVQLGLIGVAVALALVFATRGVRNLITTRGAVATYSRLIASANAGDIAAVRALCSARYGRDNPLELAREGGVVGFPRQIHPNFQVWSEGAEVWLCPGNRVGTVYRFVREGETWKYDGPVGMLRSDGLVASVKPRANLNLEKP